MWRWHRRAGYSAAEQPTLAEECEAFAAGAYLQRHVPRKERVLPWMWLNTLAHGSRADIAALGEARGAFSRTPSAAQFLAGEALRVIDRQGLNLGWLQHTFLVPLEIEISDGPAVAISVKELTASIRAALEEAMSVAAHSEASNEPHSPER